MCFMCCYFAFFFFKQKTAYEMRISDWSSDVCSSDLRCLAGDAACRRRSHRGLVAEILPHRRRGRRSLSALCLDHGMGHRGGRSEEHTSELQSLMRISYAVFCLKKKTQLHTITCKTLPISTVYRHRNYTL